MTRKDNNEPILSTAPRMTSTDVVQLAKMYSEFCQIPTKIPCPGSSGRDVKLFPWNIIENFGIFWVLEFKHRTKDRYYLEGRWCDGYPDCPNGTDEGFDTCGDVFGCGIGVEITGASQNKLNGLYDVGQDYWNNKPYFKHQTKEQRFPDCVLPA